MRSSACSASFSEDAVSAWFVASGITPQVAANRQDCVLLTYTGDRNMTVMRFSYRSGAIVLLAAAVGLAACASDSARRADSVEDAIATSSINGEAAYNDYCSGCHEAGMLGAPIVGDASDWADRSQLWDAVLLDHAITGYLEMPAKGGRMDLPEEVVKAAAEYMLETTFPDRLHDCNPPACNEDGN